MVAIAVGLILILLFVVYASSQPPRGPNTTDMPTPTEGEIMMTPTPEVTMDDESPTPESTMSQTPSPSAGSQSPTVQVTPTTRISPVTDELRSL